MNRNKLIAGLTLILVVALGAWAFGLFGGTDPAVAELQRMADTAFDDSLPEAQRDQVRGEFRQKMESLTDTQREAFFNANRDRWMQRSEQRLNDFFAMSAAEQQKRLDEIINQMTKPRENRPRSGDQAGRGRDGWRNMTEAQRDERSKRRLDQTSPKMRAQFGEFRKRLDERAKERGITQIPGWGRGGPRG